MRPMAPLVALVAAGSSVSAQELAPKIDHAPLARAARGEPAIIRARIVSMSGKPVFEPALFVRIQGLTGYSRLPMRAEGLIKNVHIAEIPSSMTSGNFDYYLEAYDEDGNGPGRAGSPETPFHVAVPQPQAPVAEKPPNLQPQPTAMQPTVIALAAPPPAKSPAVAATLAGLTGATLAVGTTLAIEFEVFFRSRMQDSINNNYNINYEEYRMGQTFGWIANVTLAAGLALAAGTIAYLAWPADAPAAVAVPKP